MVCRSRAHFVFAFPFLLINSIVFLISFFFSSPFFVLNSRVRLASVFARVFIAWPNHLAVFAMFISVS